MSDGLNESLFHLLWAKNNIFESSIKAKIPDTVIFQNCKPRFWYFTSLDGSIKKKNKDNLNLEKVLEEFSKHRSSSGILAMLYYIQDNKKHIEYLTADTLSHFCTDRKFFASEMILQRFISPQGERNNSITIIWSKNFCLFERKQNNLQLKDEKFDIYERASTFDGKEYHVSTSPLRTSDLPNRLIRISNSIVSHIAAVTFERMKVLRMLLHLKLGKDGKLWLMCATSIRYSSDPHSLPLELSNRFEVPLDKNPKNLTITLRNPASFVKLCTCAACLEKFEKTKVVDITYKDVCKLTSNNPSPILNLHSKLSVSDLKMLNKKKNFQNKKLWMCFDCYLNFSEPRLPDVSNVFTGKSKGSFKDIPGLCISKDSRSFETLPSIFSPNSINKTVDLTKSSRIFTSDPSLPTNSTMDYHNYR